MIAAVPRNRIVVVGCVASGQGEAEATKAHHAKSRHLAHGNPFPREENLLSHAPTPARGDPRTATETTASCRLVSCWGG
jgi:hypothetical protein